MVPPLTELLFWACRSPIAPPLNFTPCCAMRGEGLRAEDDVRGCVSAHWWLRISGTATGTRSWLKPRFSKTSFFVGRTLAVEWTGTRIFLILMLLLLFLSWVLSCSCP